MLTIQRNSFRAFGLCVALASAAAANAEGAPDGELTMPVESVFSDVLRFRGDVVDTLEDGRVIRKTAFLRGKQFEWVGEIVNARAEKEAGVQRSEPLDLAAISVDELAHNLRGTAFFQGHQFIEATPAYELARQLKQEHAAERSGKAGRAARGTSGSQGRVDFVRDLSAEDAANEARTVHGVDDRRVMSNTAYPHRTHIVFDNTGSTSSINGSQGSGTLIGPSTAMSVAHVFWDEGANTWESAHRWAPGFDSQDSDSSPFGDWYSCYWVTIPTAYINTESSTYDYAVLDFNVGCNSVRNGVNSDRPGASVGWLGHYVASTSAIEGRTGYMRGYPATGTCGNPGTSCGVRVWGDTSRSSENDASSSSTIIRHFADSSGGQSGSAFYHYADPTCSGCNYGAYLVGMHRAGGSTNSARRFNSTVYWFMKAYSDDY